MVSREWYRGQDIQSITCKINKPKMRRKPVKCMDTIRVVQFLHNDYILRKMSIKPSSFCANKPSLYSCNIVGILIKVIFFGGGVFLDNHNNVVFTWISCTRNTTTDNKVMDLILTFLQMGLLHISLSLQCNVFIFDCLNLIVTPSDGLSMLFLHLLNGLSMLFLNLFNSCIKSMWYNVFQDVLLKHFTLIFSRFYNDIKGTSK